MSEAYLTASPNELKLIEEESRKTTRIHRLKQVREQERKLASQRRSRYTQATRKEWSKALDSLAHQFEQDKISKVNELESVAKTILDQNWGAAHSNAIEQSELNTEYIFNLRNQTIKRHGIENLNSKIAAKHDREERIKRIEPEITKNALKRAVINQESIRSKYVVEKYREKENNSAPIYEILSNPVHSSRRIDKSALKFDETCFHREFATIRYFTLLNARCEHVNKTVDVERDALIISSHTAQHLKKKEELESKYKETAKSRYQNAIEGIVMEKVN